MAEEIPPSTNPDNRERLVRAAGAGTRKSDVTDVHMGETEFRNQIDSAEKRDKAEESESRTSKAIRTYQPKEEKSKREEDAILEQPSSKIVKTSGESGGEVTRGITTAREVFNPEEAMVDMIDCIAWGEMKDAPLEYQSPRNQGSRGKQEERIASLRNPGCHGWLPSV